MHVVVLGAGVVGACTAYYLSRGGHSVSVIDRNPEAAMEASWGNAGVITPSQVYSMASPKIWRMIRQSVIEKTGPLKFKFPPDPELLPWMFRFASYCTAARSAALTRRKFALAQDAIKAYRQIVAATGIAFDDRVAGSLNVFASESALDAAWNASAVLRDSGLVLERMDRTRLLAFEPVLGNDPDNVYGGLFSAVDWSGDPAMFTRKLLAWLRDTAGVKLEFGARIETIEIKRGRVVKLRTDKGDFEGDAYVAALGANARAVLKPIGVRPAIYPVKGYSITFPSRRSVPELNSSIVDGSRRMALTRLGNSVRVTFRAEFVGFDTSIDREMCRASVEYVRRLFGDSLDYDAARYWCGFRPMTPDGLPIVGRTKLPNLYMNAGHGHLGWTLASVTGRRVAQAIDDDSTRK